MSWPLAMVIGVAIGAGLGAITVGLMISAAIEEERQIRARTYCDGVPPEPYPDRYRETEGADETPETARPVIPRPVRGVYAKDEAMGNWRCVWVPEMGESVRPASQRGGK